MQGQYENISFSDFLKLAKAFGFELDRIRGSHHIILHPKINFTLSIQPKNNNQAKSYQIKQLLETIKEYKLTNKE